MLMRSRMIQWRLSWLVAMITILSCWIGNQPSQLYFYADTWDFLAGFVEHGVSSIWWYHNEHVIPIPKLLLYLQYQLFGMDNYYYQVINILIHSANTILLYLLSARFSLSTMARVFGTLFFSLSGVYWEVTMWETSQTTSLALFFLLLSLLLFGDYVETRENRWLVWCFLSTFASCLCMGFGILTIPLLACAAVAFGGQKVRKLIPQTVFLVSLSLTSYTLFRAILSYVFRLPHDSALPNAVFSYTLVDWVAIGFWRGMIAPNSSLTGPLTLAFIFFLITIVRFRQISLRRTLLLVLPGIWILGAYLLVGFGRHQAGAGYAVASRYQYLPMAAMALIIVWLADVVFNSIQRSSTLHAILSAVVCLSLVVHAVNGYQIIRATSPRITGGREARHFIDTFIFRRHLPEVPPDMVLGEPEFLPAALYLPPWKFPLRRALSLYATERNLPNEVFSVALDRFLDQPWLQRLSLLQGREPERHPEKWQRFGNVEIVSSDDGDAIRITLPPVTSAFGLDVESCSGRRSLYTFAVTARLIQGEAHVSPRILFKNKQGNILWSVPSEPVAGAEYQPYVMSAMPPLGASAIGVDFVSWRTAPAPAVIEVKDLLVLRHPIYLPIALFPPRER